MGSPMTACAAFSPVLRCATSGLSDWFLRGWSVTVGALPDRSNGSATVCKKTIQWTILLALRCRSTRTASAFSTRGRHDLREQESVAGRGDRRGVVESAELPSHYLPFAPHGLRRTEGDKAATDVRREAARSIVPQLGTRQLPLWRTFPVPGAMLEGRCPAQSCLPRRLNETVGLRGPCRETLGWCTLCLSHCSSHDRAAALVTSIVGFFLGRPMVGGPPRAP